MHFRRSLATERLTEIFTIQSKESNFLVKVNTTPDDVSLGIRLPIIGPFLRGKEFPAVSVITPRSFIPTQHTIQGRIFLAESHATAAAEVTNLLALV